MAALKALKALSFSRTDCRSSTQIVTNQITRCSHGSQTGIRGGWPTVRILAGEAPALQLPLGGRPIHEQRRNDIFNRHPERFENGCFVCARWNLAG